MRHSGFRADRVAVVRTFTGNIRVVHPAHDGAQGHALSWPPRGAGDTNGVSPSFGIARRSATAAGGRGTRCSFPAFMPLPGTVNSDLSGSTSAHVIQRWPHLVRPFGGMAKVDLGCFQAASCSVISVIA